jgi:uncharacterized repeat protein (TIGR01451 family)
LITADQWSVSAANRIWKIACLCACAAFSTPAGAAGTSVGTVIENTATVEFVLAGTPVTLTSNTTTITVIERIDVVVTLQSPQVPVAANGTNHALLFTVTNTGNGTETFQLAIDSVIGGSDFDPAPSAPDSIFFDTDGSGDFNIANDQPYVPGTNEPVLPADGSVDVFLLNDIPGTVTNGDVGQSELTAISATGTGLPGAEFVSLGDGGVDAIVGSTGGEASGIGEYLVSDVQVSVIKSQLVTDPFGGTQPVPGAVITYTVTVEVTTPGTATASVLADPIPENSTFIPTSIMLDSVGLSDATDVDAGEFDTTGLPTVVVRLGDLTSASGAKTVVFQVTID